MENVGEMIQAFHLDVKSKKLRTHALHDFCGVSKARVVKCSTFERADRRFIDNRSCVNAAEQSQLREEYAGNSIRPEPFSNTRKFVADGVSFSRPYLD